MPFPPPLPLPGDLTEWDEEVQDEEALRQVEPNEPLELVSVENQRPERTFWIGTRLSLELRKPLKCLLFEHQDFFAWCHEDMPGIDNSIIEHRLYIDPEARKFK